MVVAGNRNGSCNLVVPPAMDRALFDRIKTELPRLIRSRETRVEFVDHPLILGQETCEGASNAKFSGSDNSCYLVISEINTGAERDAINFEGCGLIKVSRPLAQLVKRCVRNLPLDLERSSG